MKAVVFSLLALAASASFAAPSSYVLPVATAKVKERVYTTTVALQNRNDHDVTCEFIYAIPRDARGGTLRSQERVPAGQTRVFEDVLKEAGAVGTIRIACSDPVLSVARLQASLDGGQTFDEGRVFVGALETDPITKTKPRKIVTDRDLLAVEMLGEPANFKAIVRDSKGVAIGQKTYELPAFAQQVINLSKVLEGTSSVEVEVVVPEGTGGIGVTKVSRDAEINKLAVRQTSGQEARANAQLQAATSATPLGRSVLDEVGAARFQAAPFQDPATGLIYFRHRWYSPETGTFISPDPMGYEDSANLYAFAKGDPVNGRDPLGLEVAASASTFVVSDVREGKKGITYRIPRAWAGQNKIKMHAILLYVGGMQPTAAENLMDSMNVGLAKTGPEAMAAIGANAMVADAAIKEVMKVYAVTAVAGLTGGAAGTALGATGLGIWGTAGASGFAGGVAGQATSDVIDRRFSGVKAYLTSGAVSGGLAIGVTGVVSGVRSVRAAASWGAEFSEANQGWASEIDAARLGRSLSTKYKGSVRLAVPEIEKMAITQQQRVDVVTEMFRASMRDIAGTQTLEDGTIVMTSRVANKQGMLNQPILGVSPNGKIRFGFATLTEQSDHSIVASDIDFPQ